MAFGLLLASGCAGLGGAIGQALSGKGSSEPKEDKGLQETTRKELAAFEALPVPVADLKKGDTDSFLAALKQATSLKVDIVRRFKDPEQGQLLERVQAKRKAYILEASQVSLANNDANQAYWVLNPLIDDSFKYADVDKDVLAAARTAAKARAAARQAEQAKYKNYAADGIGGNCVFSTTPFKGDGKNPEVSYYLQGKRTQVYVRCYSKTDISRQSGPDGKFYVRLSINEYVGWGQPAGTPEQVRPGTMVIDGVFTVPEGDITKDDFASIDAEAGFQWISGYTWQGDNRVPTYGTTALAGSTFFWERDPKTL